MNDEPSYHQPVDYAAPMLAIADHLGARRKSMRVIFPDGSELELYAVDPRVNRKPSIRLPPADERAARAAVDRLRHVPKRKEQARAEHAIDQPPRPQLRHQAARADG